MLENIVRRLGVVDSQGSLNPSRRSPGRKQKVHHGNRRQLAMLTATSTVCLSSLPLMASSGTWSSAVSGSWATGSNWVSGNIPGATSTANSDIAYFNNSGASGGGIGGITVDTNRSVGGFDFGSPAGVYNPFYFSGGSLLLNNSGGSILGDSTFTGNADINTPITLQAAGNYSLTQNGGLGSGLQTFSTISPAANLGNFTLNVNGTNAGLDNVVYGILNQGSGTTVSLSKSGTGTWVLAAANTYTGGTTLNGGILIADFATALGTSGTIDFTGNTTLRTWLALTDPSSRIKIEDGVTATVDTFNTNQLFLTPLMTGSLGTGALTKAGAGTLIVGSTASAGNTYTGATTIRQGTLSLDFNQSTSVTSNLISSSSPLVLGGGTLSTRAKYSVTQGFTQTFNGTTLTAGGSSLSFFNVAAGATVTLDLGALARNTGATLNTGTVVAGVTVKASGTSLDAGGVIPGVIYGNNDFATLASNVLGAATYTTDNTAADWSSGTVNYQTSGTGMVTGTIGSGGTTTINALKLNNSNTSSPVISGTLVVNDGILFGSGIGANTSNISGGSITGPSGSNKDLLIVNNNSQTASQRNLISSAIVDNGSPLNVTLASYAGTLAVSGANTYTGNTYINGGTIQVGGNSIGYGTSAGTTYITNGATLQIGGTITSLTAGDVKGTVEVDNGTLSMVQSGTDTLSATVTGVGGAGIINMAGGGTAIVNVGTSGTNYFSQISNTNASSSSVLILRGPGSVNQLDTSAGNVAGFSCTNNSTGRIQVESGTWLDEVQGSNSVANLNVYGGTIVIDAVRQASGTWTISNNGGANTGGTVIVSGVDNQTSGNSNVSRFLFGSVAGDSITIANGGTLIVNSNNYGQGLNSGVGGNVTINQTGGLAVYGVNQAGNNFGSASGGLKGFQLGNSSSGQTGTYNLSGGTAIFGVNISGGTTASTNSALNFTGGKLVLASINTANLANATFNVGGGATLANLAPSDSFNVSGRSIIAGNLSLLSNSELSVNLGGTIAASVFHDSVSKYDNFNISGTATLTGGALNVTLLSSYVPNNNDTFNIVTAGGGVSGVFTNAPFNSSSGSYILPYNSNGDFFVNYGANSVSLVYQDLSNLAFTWNHSTGANWNTGSNWDTGTVPNGQSRNVQFYGALTSGSPNNVVNLDVPITVGNITFNNSSYSYVLSGNTLTFDNTSSKSSSLSDMSGSHTIASPVALNSNLSAGVTNSGDVLTINGAISGTSKSLTLSGAGTLLLTGANTYSGPTTVSSGTLQIGDGTNGHDATFSTNGISVASTASVVFNTTSGTYNVNYPITGTGQIIKNGTNTLNLTVANAFGTTGSTHTSQGVQINGGTVNLGVAYAANASSNTSINVGAGANVTESVANGLSGFSGINLGTSTSSATINYNNNTGFYSGINGGNLTLGAGGGVGTALLFFGYGTLTASTNLTGTNSITTPVHLNAGGDSTAGSATIKPGGDITFNCQVGTVSNYAHDYFTTSDGAQTLNVDNTLTSIVCPVRLGLRTAAPFTIAGTGEMFISGTIADYNTSAYGGGSIVYSGTGVLVLTNSNNNYSGGTTVNSGMLITSGVSAIGSGNLNMNGTGGAIFRNTSASAIFPLAQSGYNNGYWNGNGINSTVAANDPSYLHAVGFYQPSGTISFEAQTVGTLDTAVKLTWYGDADLSGKVDGTDYSRVDVAFLADESNPTAYTGWQNGDFNYDGTVNGSDYTLMDNAFNTQGTQIAAQVAAQVAGQAGGNSAVPEPATLSVIGMGAIGILARRRRRH